MSTEIASRTIRRRGKAETTVMRQKVTVEPREHRPSLAESIANSNILIKHWYWPGSTEVFPFHATMRKVDVYFPYAKDVKGRIRPLLIDFCDKESDVAAIEPKRKALVAAGFKYLILRPRMTFNEAMMLLGDD